MLPDHIARLVRTFRVGERVRASLTIYYAVGDLTIAEGKTGTVRAVSAANVPLVHWDGMLDGLSFATSPDSIDPVDEVQREASYTCPVCRADSRYPSGHCTRRHGRGS